MLPQLVLVLYEVLTLLVIRGAVNRKAGSPLEGRAMASEAVA